MIVRVNDRGPYHGGRVMDVSQRVAEALAFKNEGTGRIRIDYVGRASLSGSDDAKLLATLTTDGRPAHLDGTADPVRVADNALPPPPDEPSPLPNVPARVAALPIFRRGHVLAPTVIAAAPSEPLAPAVPVAPPGPRGLVARPFGGPSVRRAFPPGRDPFFHPLFPAPRAQPNPGISFAVPEPRAGNAAGRPGAERRRPRRPAEAGTD